MATAFTAILCEPRGDDALVAVALPIFFGKPGLERSHRDQTKRKAGMIMMIMISKKEGRCLLFIQFQEVKETPKKQGQKDTAEGPRSQARNKRSNSLP